MATLRMAENFEEVYTYEAKNWYTFKKCMCLLINRGNFENSNFFLKFGKKYIQNNEKLKIFFSFQHIKKRLD